jgi:hypothetical protein
VKCDDVCAKLPVSVLIGDRWIDGRITNYNLGHSHGRDNWTGHVHVKFTDADPADCYDDDKVIVRVPAALIGSHLRERKEAP